jgi:hypothetical protein
MATPTMVTISGTLNPLLRATQVVCYIPQTLRHNASNSVYLPTPITATVAANGTFELIVPAGNDPAWAPLNLSSKFTIVGPDLHESFWAVVPYSDQTLDFSVLVPSDPSDGTLYATFNHTHTSASLSAAVLEAIERAGRVFGTTELIVPRNEASHFLRPTTGQLYIAHYTALATRTYLRLRTSTGAAAGGTTSAWVGVLDWTGTQYIPNVVSVDDPTRWANPNASYPTQIFKANLSGAADLADPGFDQVEGQEYGMFVLWNGSGSGPELACAAFNPDDAFLTPRKAVYMPLAAPPSGNLQAEWVAGASPRYQALLMDS